MTTGADTSPAILLDTKVSRFSTKGADGNASQAPPPDINPRSSYFIGVWRRTPYHVAEFPMCLSGLGGRAELKGYDEAEGVLWLPLSEGNGSYLLQVQDCASGKRWLTADLKMTTQIEEALRVNLTSVPPFRGGPGDVAVKISTMHGKVLVSNEAGAVMFMNQREADARDEAGVYLYNDAWELSPEEILEMSDPFLDRYMDITRFDASFDPETDGGEEPRRP